MSFKFYKQKYIIEFRKFPNKKAFIIVITQCHVNFMYILALRAVSFVQPVSQFYHLIDYCDHGEEIALGARKYMKLTEHCIGGSDLIKSSSDLKFHH